MRLTRIKMRELLKQTDHNIATIKQGILKGNVTLSRDDKAILDMIHRQTGELSALARLVVEAQDESK